MTRLDRRELLATFLGGPAAALLAGCRGPRETPPIPGQLAGASQELGHRVRDLREIPEPSAGRWTDREAVVVGGGVAGLTAARRLRRGGVRSLSVLELEAAAGGTSRSGRGGRTAFPWGAHYLPAPRPHQTELVQLLEEMRLVEGRGPDGRVLIAEQHLCRDPQERIFYRGRWMEGLYLEAGASPQDLAQRDRFQQLVDGWIDWRDGAGHRAFDLPMARCSGDDEPRQLDRVSMAQWLRDQGLSSPRLWWLVDYACRDDYGLTVEQTSAWAGLFYFAARVPAAGQESQPLITWPEGNGRLVRQLLREIEPDVELSRAVVDIAFREHDAGGGGIELRALDPQGIAWGYRARHVVFAAPHFLAPHLIRPWRSERPAHVDDFSYGSWMVANLQLRDRPRSRGFPLCWDNVIYDSPSLGYVVATHQSDLDYGPTVLTYYYPLCDESPAKVRARLLGTGQPEWAELAVSDLSRAHPGLRRLVERVDVMRWGHAMVRPRTGFLFGGSREAGQRPYRGIHFAHSDLSGLPLFEEAYDRGNRAADAILAERRREA